MKTIPYGRQYIDSQDIGLVSKVLKEDLITTGNFVKKFENKISKFLKVKFSLTCSSGTSALHLSLLAIKLKKNDVIIMPSVNFIAAYSMAKLFQARIFLADVDSYSGQMTPGTLLTCIKKNKIKNIKAIITMHLGGYAENIYEFYKIKKKYNCYLIEDACHALGSAYMYKNKIYKVGSCMHADLSTFSLHPVKTITSAEGGIVTTNNIDLYKRILLYRSHGIVRKNHWDYDIKYEGFNYRLSDINCALGLSQIKKIKKFLRFRKYIFNFYKVNLNDQKIFFFPCYKNIKFSAFHLFIVKINFNKLSVNKDYFIAEMLKNKIILQFHYKPIFLFKKLLKKKYNKKNFSGALKYYKSVVSLPIYYGLTNNKLMYIIKKIKLFTKYHSK
jgi:dTDP-4-amino-4,6-dideoxygalactose transaminase